MKVLVPKLSDGVRLMAEVMSESRLSDTKRLKEIIGQLKSRLEMMMIGNGHTVAVNRATSCISLAGMYREYEEGLAYYRFIEKLNKDFDTQKEQIVKELKETAKLIFSKGNVLLDVTGSEVSLNSVVGEMISVLEPVLAESDETISGCEDGILPEVRYALERSAEGVGTEAYTTAGMVQYDACAGDFSRAG